MYEFAVTPAVTQFRRPGVIITEITPEVLAEELELAQRATGSSASTAAPCAIISIFAFKRRAKPSLTLLVKKPNGETLGDRTRTRRRRRFRLDVRADRAAPMRQRMSFLFLQRQSGRRAPVAFRPRRRHSPFVSLRQLHDAFSSITRRRDEAHRRAASFAAICFGSRDRFENARLSARR